MRAAEFQKLLGELGKLDAGQRAAAIRVLSGVDETRQAIEILEAGRASGPACPHCGHAHVLGACGAGVFPGAAHRRRKP